jgi:hypothetical protein
LISSLLACGEAKYYGRKGMVEQRCSPYGGSEAEREGEKERERREERGSRTRYIHLKAYPRDLLPPNKLHFQVSTTSQ